MKLREDIDIFVETIKENDNIKYIEIEIYNYTIRESELFTRIEDFDFYMKLNEGHEVSLDNIVINNHVLDNKLTYKDLALLLSSSEPHLVNEIIKYLGVSVERAIEILEDSFIVDARNELDAFRTWFEVCQSYTYDKIVKMQIVPGITGAECYVDWEAVYRDYVLSSIIEVFNVDDTYVIH